MQLMFSRTAHLFLCISASTCLIARADPMVEIQRLPADAIHPQTSTDSRGRVHLIYFKGDPRHGDLFYARSDGGKSFSDAKRVNSQPCSVIVIGTIRGPQLAIGRGDRVHVAWMGSDQAEPKVNGSAAPMLYSRLNEAGDGFEPQRNVITAHPGLDGGGSIAADSEGNVYVAWHAPDREKGEVNRRVWIARSKDDGKTFAAETAASAAKLGACGCCGMRIAASAGGHVFVLFRSAAQSIHRDMQLLESDDYGKTFKSVASDPWQNGACVMSTSAFAQMDSGLLAAWETRDQIYVFRLDAAPTPIAVPGRAMARKHPAIAINARNEFIVVWAEGTGWNKGGSVAWQVFSKDGKPMSDQAGHVDGLTPWDVPAVFATQDNRFRIIF